MGLIRLFLYARPMTRKRLAVDLMVLSLLVAVNTGYLAAKTLLTLQQSLQRASL